MNNTINFLRGTDGLDFPLYKRNFNDLDNHTVKYCYISPIKYLDQIPKKSDLHLTLAHLIEDEEYAKYYMKRKSENGDIIIMDNSAFEFKKPLSMDEMFKLMDDNNFHPDYVVAPDYPFEDWEKTYDSAMEFVGSVKYSDRNIGIMTVPQSEKGDVEGWVQCWKRMINNPYIDIIGYSILGIPNAFCEMTGTEDISFNRIFASVYLRNILLQNDSLYDNFRKKWHHYLGASDIREIVTQKQIGIMDSLDSSSVFWSAINGFEYDDSMGGLKDGKVQIPVDFHVKYEYSNTVKIDHNIKYMENVILKNQ